MFNQLKIGSRLTLGFGVVLALLCALAGLSAWQMKRLADAADYYAVNLVPSFDVEAKVIARLGDLRRWEFRHVLANTDAEMDEAEAKLAGYRKETAEMLDRFGKDLVSDDEDRKLLERVRTGLAAYTAVFDNKVRPVSRQTATDPAKTAEAAALMKGESSAAYSAVHAAVHEWFAYNVKLSDLQKKAAGDTYGMAKLSLGVMVVLALCLGAGAAVLITRSITVPIQRAVEVATTVAEGDLSSRIVAQGSDETAQLLQALARMNENLARIVGEVRHGSDSIATGSAQIASGNADLSQRTEEQASNLQQTAASMEEMSANARQSADTARAATQLAQSASEAASRGGDVVGRVVATMDEISASSRKISDIIGTIDGIAFQTNILALNAAVEAARAGEQGRGFAVVASEVRNLAQRSADAAREIKNLISQSVEKVEAGSHLVSEAGTTIDDVVLQVKRVSDMIAEIGAATQEQNDGVGQVSHAVTQLDQVTQQNAALVEQSAAAAESLKHQADRLAQAVGVFKLA